VEEKKEREGSEVTAK